MFLVWAFSRRRGDRNLSAVKVSATNMGLSVAEEGRAEVSGDEYGPKCHRREQAIGGER